MASKKILVTGVSGTGKTTVCRELSKRGVATIGIDETKHLSYWINKETHAPIVGDVDFSDEFLRTHEWVCDVQLFKKLVDDVEGPVVVCGSVGNISECIEQCDVTLLLVCAPQTFLARIDAREDNPFGQNDASKQALLGYYREYNREVRETGAIPIDAEQPIDAVVDEVVTYI